MAAAKPARNKQPGKPKEPRPAARVDPIREAAAVPDRLLSMNALSKLIGKDRSTLYRWVDAGCPVHQRADTESGKDWTFDVAKVWEWRERRVVEEEIERLVPRGSGGADGEPQSDEERMRIGLLALQYLTKQKTVVLVDDVDLLWARALGVIRLAVMALPHRFLRRISGLTPLEMEHHTALLQDDAADVLTQGNREVERFVRDARKARQQAAGDVDALGDGDEGEAEAA